MTEAYKKRLLELAAELKEEIDTSESYPPLINAAYKLIGYIQALDIG